MDLIDIALSMRSESEAQFFQYGLVATGEAPVFFGTPERSQKREFSKRLMKVYADGARHRIALPVKDKKARVPECEAYFSFLYAESVEQGLDGVSQFLHIRNGLIEKYDEEYLNGELFSFGFSLDTYIANRIERKLWRRKSEVDAYFDSIYFDRLKRKVRDRDIPENLKAALIERFGESPLWGSYVAERIKSKRKNLYERKKRFRRKSYLNAWTHFVTFTCDDKKCSISDFERKLKKCLSNLHTRRGWKYAVVKEYGEKTGRVHFHGLFYIPDGQMVGAVKEVREYNLETKKIEVRYRNSFFYDSFGRNDFAPISGSSRAAYRPAIEYIWKYMGKTDERLFYSFNLPTELLQELSADDIACEIYDFCVKYILFDDVFEDGGDVSDSAAFNFGYDSVT